MKLSDRQQQILDWVRTEEHLSVDTLAERFDVTPQTVRKDVNQLCESGLLRRRYGGVSLPSSVTNISFSSRQVLNQYAKQAIARELAHRIPENSSVYLGIGTTVEFVARELSEHAGLKVFTNNLNVASLLCNSPGIEVRVSGGQLRHNDHDVVGEEATEFFSSYLADFGVIGAGSLDMRFGMMDFELREARVSQAIIANSRHRVLVADQSKWRRSALAKVGVFSDLDLFITDRLPSPEQANWPASVPFIEADSDNRSPEPDLPDRVGGPMP